MSADPDICPQMIPDGNSGYTRNPRSLDNATGNDTPDVTGNIADAEFSFATEVLRAERVGVGFRDPGGDRPGEVITYKPDNGGQWAVCKITPMQALYLARQMIDFAMRRTT